MRIHVVFLASQAFLLAAGAVAAEEGRYPWSGDWYLKIGATGFLGPEYEGSSKRMLQAAPLVSLGKAGSAVRFRRATTTCPTPCSTRDISALAPSAS